MKTVNKKEKDNSKILESKRIIKEEKKKIKLEKKLIRKRKKEHYKKTKFGKTKIGKILGKIFFVFSDKNNYSFSEVFIVTIVSILLGVFACLSVLTIIGGGRNYFKLINDFNKLYDVYDVLIDNYYGDIDKNKLVESAINGMVSSVGDVYTSYNNVSTTDSFNQIVNGTYEGIGCSIRQSEKEITIFEVYDDTPASKAGLKKGDIVKTVDDMDALKLGVNKLSNYIKSEAKGKIKMVIIRDDNEITLTLERGKVEIPSISSEIFEENNKKIGYIDISIFSSVSGKQFKTSLDNLEEKGIDALVIDVRDNSGGYLSTVTDIASYLLPKGEIIYKVQNGDKTTTTKDKTAEKRKYPIAIITNSNSASASEILAAAIKESYHGFVVGTKTYGKGTVQQVKQLSDGSMIKYTVENWLTPLGNWINEKGIEPTDEVKLSDEYLKDPKKENDNQLNKALELVSK